jgi:hypothetical protein
VRRARGQRHDFPTHNPAHHSCGLTGLIHPVPARISQGTRFHIPGLHCSSPLPHHRGHLSYSQVPALAKRHKVEAKKDSASAQELLAKQVGTYDEPELCKLLLGISLLDSAYQRPTANRDDVLMDAAKRYRVDTEKLQKTVAKEFADQREKRTKAKAKPRNRKAPA